VLKLDTSPMGTAFVTIGKLQVDACGGERDEELE
jgi:hypothetical protein